MTAPANPFPPILGLTLTEARILMCILGRAPAAIVRADIHATVYGAVKLAPCPRVIEKHAKQVREKLALYGIALCQKRAQGYFLSEEDARALHKWIAKARRPLPGPLDPIPIALVVAYFGERDRSPRAIHKMLNGETSLDNVKQILSRARRAGRDIPLWRGALPRRPGDEVATTSRGVA